MRPLPPDRFMAFVKGHEKLELLQQAVLDVPSMLPVVFCDLDAFGCLPADQLDLDVPEGKILTTRYKSHQLFNMAGKQLTDITIVFSGRSVVNDVLPETL